MDKTVNIVMAVVLSICSLAALVEGIIHLAPQMFFLATVAALVALMLLAEVKKLKEKGDDA